MICCILVEAWSVAGSVVLMLLWRGGDRDEHEAVTPQQSALVCSQNSTSGGLGRHRRRRTDWRRFHASVHAPPILRPIGRDPRYYVEPNVGAIHSLNLVLGESGGPLTPEVIERLGPHRVNAESCAMGTDSPDLVVAMRLLDELKLRGFQFQRIAPGVDGPLAGYRVSGDWADLIHIEGFSRDCFAWRQRTSPLIVPGAQTERQVEGSALDVLREVLAWQAGS